jgi:hypothetical protein
LGENICKRGGVFVIAVGSKQVCQHFNLVADLQALGANQTLENLVEGVLLNENRGEIEIYVRTYVLLDKPYLEE